VFPIVAIGGLVAILAIATAGVVMVTTRNDFLAVIAGMASAALLRAAGL
jgi:branched-subunit amino acid transport protein